MTIGSNPIIPNTLFTVFSFLTFTNDPFLLENLLFFYGPRYHTYLLYRFLGIPLPSPNIAISRFFSPNSIYSLSIRGLFIHYKDRIFDKPFLQFSYTCFHAITFLFAKSFF